MAKSNVPTVKESVRSKKLSTLETPEDLQKDIQEMYSEAKKAITKVKDKNKLHQKNHILQGIIKNVNDTKDITKMVYSQVVGFWHNTYSLLEMINQ